MSQAPRHGPAPAERRLLRPVSEIAAWTFASRFLGFLRDVLFAAALGAGPAAEAFIVALRLPAMFRSIFAEGAFNAAFGPIYARRLERGGEEEAQGWAASVLAALALALSLLTLVAWAAMPWIVAVLAPGFGAEGERHELAVVLARIAFPYLLLTACASLFAGVCNAHGFFSAGAIAPIFFNLCLIAVLLLFSSAPDPVLASAMAAAVSFSGVLQAAYIARAAARKTGLRPFKGAGLRATWQRLRAERPELARLARLLAAAALGTGAFQINLLVATAVSSWKTGGVSHLYYAQRLYHLPLAMIGIAIAAVLLPDLAAQLAAGRERRARDDFNRALEGALLLSLPAAFGLAALSGPIVSVLFERGAFIAADASATAAALAAFALGLPAYVAVRVMQPAFYAREDAKTPMRASLMGAGANLVATVPAFLAAGAAGVALAASLGGWVTAAFLHRDLRQRCGWHSDARLARRAGGCAAAALLMGAGALAAHRWTPGLEGMMREGNEAARFACLLALLAFGAGLYFALVLLLGGAKASELRRLASLGRGGRGGRGRAPPRP